MMGLPKISKYFFSLILVINISSCAKQKDYATRKTPVKNQEIIQTGNNKPIYTKPYTAPQHAQISQNQEAKNNNFYDYLFNQKENNKKVVMEDQVANNNINLLKQEAINKQALQPQKITKPKRISNQDLYYDPYKKKQTTATSSSKKHNSKAKKSEGFYIQIGAYSKKSNALKIQEKLKNYNNVIINENRRNNKILNKVMIGPLNSLISSIEIQKKLERDGFSKTIIIHEK